jgi:hypothetical protein
MLAQTRIYLLIARSFTPMAVLILGHNWWWIIPVAMWTLALSDMLRDGGDSVLSKQSSCFWTKRFDICMHCAMRSSLPEAIVITSRDSFA